MTSTSTRRCASGWPPSPTSACTARPTSARSIASGARRRRWFRPAASRASGSRPRCTASSPTTGWSASTPTATPSPSRWSVSRWRSSGAPGCSASSIGAPSSPSIPSYPAAIRCGSFPSTVPAPSRAPHGPPGPRDRPSQPATSRRSSRSAIWRCMSPRGTYRDSSPPRPRRSWSLYGPRSLGWGSVGMSAAQLERLQEHLQRLRLFKSRERLEALLQEATAKEVSYADFLDQVLTEEVASKTAKHISMRTQLARFPFVKGLESFDFSYQPSIDKKQIQTLSSCHFVEHGENLVILGPPGVGKTHLAVGLGLKAIEHGYRVLFTTAAVLIAALTKALAEGRLDDKLKVYTMPRLLIVDEIGYLPIDRQGANLFFQLISRRYERGPMILTSNQSFGSWGEVFGDRVIATAILDRILHHAITLNIRGNSYRLKDKLKAGLVRPAEASELTQGWALFPSHKRALLASR